VLPECYGQVVYALEVSFYSPVKAVIVLTTGHILGTFPFSLKENIKIFTRRL